MKSTLASFAAFLALVPLVAGHGWVGWISVDGKKYDGNAPMRASVQSPIRTLTDNGPSNPSSTDMACGLGASNAALVADVSPGSTLTVQWTTHDGLTWRHAVGPIMTYMASCGSTSCDKFDASGAKWFKIAQFSYSDTASKTWWQNLLYTNQPIDVKLPTNLAPGGYLIRHEIISLQGEAAEFYPTCFQVNMGGSGNGAPDGTLSFPGAYTASDYPVNAYQFDPVDFHFVGGPLSNLANPDQTPGGTAGVAGGAGGEAGTGSTNSSSSGTPASSGSASAGGVSTQTSMPAASMSSLTSVTVSSTTMVTSSPVSTVTTQGEAAPPVSTGRCRANFKRSARYVVQSRPQRLAH